MGPGRIGIQVRARSATPRSAYGAVAKRRKDGLGSMHKYPRKPLTDVSRSGVAIGSSVGHAIGGLFSGGSSEPAPAPQQQAAVQTQNQQQQQQWGSNNCAGAAQQFTKCLDDNGGNMQICNWYLEQLKACQAAASQY
ncbi:CHCH domain-containing protein [Purpureocillium lilacinum]|uniref:CHCH domain-containing protein n=1 Tax=Purpureocillium lilacinum TaxID=33203 RepID=A0A179H9X2_PURLI|nr:CHCH domain-containing protein [Purpureocillium lilacinum]OAQ86331.1 CHCH domain-containing protein [Purpureocillium lilacinum]OAQ94291.1 CHCH domain-containing protein [Purpureocillium lilacinum]